MANIKGPNGNIATVTDGGLLNVSATTQSLAEALNLAGLVFSVSGSVTPAGAGDYFMYIQNVGTVDLAASIFSFSSTVPTEIKVDHVSGDPIYVGAVPADITNLNLGSSNALPAIANIDTNITGITKVGQLFYEECPVPDTRNTQGIISSIVIPQGKAIGIRRMAATGEINISIGMGIVPQ